MLRDRVELGTQRILFYVLTCSQWLMLALRDSNNYFDQRFRLINKEIILLLFPGSQKCIG